MKLYATTTSERATKGQGGNQYIDITLKDENENVFAVLHANLLNGKPRLSLLACNYDTACTIEFNAIEILKKYKDIAKGEKKKGENFFSKDLNILDENV